MNKLFIISILTIMVATPSLATGIAANANSASCTESVLETTSGISNLEANWTANTLNIEWYNGDDKITSTTCSYDGGITIPSTDPEKTGYTFSGWRLRAAAAPAPAQCNLTGFDATKIADIGYSKGLDTNGSFYCRKNSSNFNCSSLEDLDVYEYKGEFTYGVVKGLAKCITKIGKNTTGDWSDDPSNWSATETEISSYENGRGWQCWCGVTDFTPSDGSKCSVVSSNWIFYNTYSNDISSCKKNCSKGCMLVLRSASTYGARLRSVMFGQI